MSRLYKRGSTVKTKAKSGKWDKIGWYCHDCGNVVFDDAILNRKHKQQLTKA